LYDSSQRQNYRSVFDLAISKLLCGAPDDHELGTFTVNQKCAVLSQRLALDINSATYNTTGAARNYDMSHKLQTQIASHMRVCIVIPKDLVTVRGIAASEPILSEAASFIMRTYTQFNLSQALLDVLDSFAIDHGERGELLVAALFTEARDTYASQDQPSLFPNDLSQFCPVFSVIDLLSCLFTEESFEAMLKSSPSVRRTDFPLELQEFGDVFKNTYMHFNHLIKPFKQKVITRQYLLGIMARGAAALGANNQKGYDIVYPFLFRSEDLIIENVGFIMIQVKNYAVNKNPDADLFREMDPFICKLLSAKHDSSGFTTPIIRIVFSLGGEKPGLEPMVYSSPSCGAQTLDNMQDDAMFTSYDFWCSGLDSDVLRPVTQKTHLKYKQLLGKTNKWGGLFSRPTSHVRCSQYPGGGTDVYHYNAWMKSDHISDSDRG
jgi:hypothetical protein